MKIKFGGKERGFQWGAGCIEKYCGLMGGDLDTLSALDGNGVSKIRASGNLLLAAMLNYCELNDKPVDFNYTMVINWLDEADQGMMNTLMADFLQSKFLGRTIEEYFMNTSVDETNKATSKRKKKDPISTISEGVQAK